MSLYYRLKRRLGHDTTTEATDSQYIVKYTVHHLNGDTSTVRAHGYKVDGAFAKFYVENDLYVWQLGGPRVSPCGRSTVRVLEGIKEIEGEAVQATSYHATVDRADGSVVGKRVENPVGGSDEQ